MSFCTPVLVAALAMLAAAPAEAIVTYSFTLFSGTSLVYNSPDFITVDRHVPASALQSCQYLGDPTHCGTIDFLVAVGPFGDSIFFNGFDGGYGTGFAAHVFQNPGVYGGDRPTAQLSVSIAPGVPEPATWALLITGFALTGVAVRRRSSVIA